MNKRLLAGFVVAALAPTAALATTGYFSHGYGLKAKGMGGVGIALPQDAMAPASTIPPAWVSSATAWISGWTGSARTVAATSSAMDSA